MVLGFAALACASVGISPTFGQTVHVRPLAFPHPDEILRGRGFAVLADRRTFVVTAFLNAVGYDEEADGTEMHPVRVEVREAISRNLDGAQEKVETWRRFYAEGGLPLFVYLDFALSLSEDYPFERIRPVEEVGYPQVLEHTDALIPMLNEFWVEADLGAVWEEVKPSYLEELQAYDFPRMEGQMRFLWDYLRLPRSDTYTIVNVPNLLGQHYTAIGADYEDYYYTVETPGAQSYALNIHEYLHSIVNPATEGAFGPEKEKLLRYYEVGQNGDLAAAYQEPVTFVAECLVRALDYRLRWKSARDEEDSRAIRERVGELTEGGLSLVEPLFDGLAAFEEGGEDFAQYLPTLFARLPEPPSPQASRFPPPALDGRAIEPLPGPSMELPGSGERPGSPRGCTPSPATPSEPISVGLRPRRSSSFPGNCPPPSARTSSPPVSTDSRPRRLRTGRVGVPAR